MSINLSPEIIAEIKTIAEKYPVSKIVLFGSRAKGNSTPTSDIDLAIYTFPEFSSKGRLASDMEDLNTLLKIDIVFINENIDIELVKNIQEEGVVIYERLQAKVRKL